MSEAISDALSGALIGLEAIIWIDGIVYIMVLLSVLIGVWRGLFASLFGITALLLAIYIAWNFSILFEPSLSPLLGDSVLTPVAAAALVFLISFFLLGLVAKIFIIAFKKVDVGGFNLLGGALFGLLRGVLFALIFVLLLSAFGAHKSRAWGQATTVPLLGIVLQQIMAVPVLSPYRVWLSFDAVGRPALVNARKIGPRDPSEVPQWQPQLEVPQLEVPQLEDAPQGDAEVQQRIERTDQTERTEQEGQEGQADDPAAPQENPTDEGAEKTKGGGITLEELLYILPEGEREAYSDVIEKAEDRGVTLEELLDTLLKGEKDGSGEATAESLLEAIQCELNKEEGKDCP